MIWWKVTLVCSGHPFLPEPHDRYVQATTAEIAGKRAAAQLRADYHYRGEIEVCSVESVIEPPQQPSPDRKELLALRRQVRAVSRQSYYSPEG